jgi:uncharacterized protein YlxW (UPF0749 family)
MKLFGWFEKLITEHGSAATLRDHVALLKKQLADCNAKNEILQSQLEKANIEIVSLGNVRKSLKDQTQLQQRIAQLEAMNQDLERQLRIKSIGF